MTETIARVVVVDDQRLICESIAALLDLQPGIAVVGTAADGVEAIEVVERVKPDVVLMDVRMPRMDGVAAAAELARIAPECRVVMLTTFDDERYVRGALRAGASGYLLKDRPASDLAAAIRMAHLGVAQFDPAVLDRLIGTDDSRAPVLDTPLSDREVHVLRLLAAGSTNREIARTLHLSEGTVKNHVSRILERLGLQRRTQAALYARDRGIS